jgi:hypothetical protein
MKKYKLHKCEYENCENMTTNMKYCSLSCSGTIGGKRVHELHPELSSENGKKAAEICKIKKIGAFYDSKIRITNCKKAAETNKINGTGLYDSKIKSMGGLASIKVLRKNHRNLLYDGQYYDSKPEIEVSIWLQKHYKYIPIEEQTLHIQIGHCEYDYLLKDLKLFVEKHSFWKNTETEEEYFEKRRDNLNKHGYKDYSLVVIA